jgi:hypothetical protein
MQHGKLRKGLNIHHLFDLFHSLAQGISDYTVAEAIGFQNLPFLLMEKGSTLRIMGRSHEARDIFTRAIDEFTSRNVD